MNTSHITNLGARAFWEQFARDRETNTEFYRRVPQDKLDFRMVDRPQWNTERYQAIMTVDMRAWSKKKLIQELEKTTSEVASLLSEEETPRRMVRVPWAKDLVAAVTFLWGLDSHEILHTGWNLALMDHLGIARFPALKAMWG